MQTIGSGDWIAPIARLTGTQWIAAGLFGFRSIPRHRQGLRRPSIAGWQDGKITHLKAMVDVLAILRQIGLA